MLNGSWSSLKGVSFNVIVTFRRRHIICCWMKDKQFTMKTMYVYITWLSEVVTELINEKLIVFFFILEKK